MPLCLSSALFFPALPSCSLMSQQHLILNRTGDKMPIVGFGTWKVENDQAHDVVYNAIKVGYVSSYARDGRALMNDSSAASYSAL